MMFKKVNLRDRRWWLSTFYSLCIQSYVRRALLVIEKQLFYPGLDDPPQSLNSEQYLHLITVLFIAVSFQYDPLSAGRLQPPITDESATPDITVPELYLASARSVCGAQAWSEEGIKTSYQFLTRLLNVSSLDFDGGSTDIAMTDVPVPSSRPESRTMSIVGNPYQKWAASSASNAFHPKGPCSSIQQKRSSLTPSFDSSTTAYSGPNSSKASLGGSLWTQSTAITSPSCGTISPRSSFSDKRWSAGSMPGFIPPGPSSAGQTSGPLSPQPESTAKVPLLPRPDRKPSLRSHPSTTTFICKCCPKRPWTFQTAEELRYGAAHPSDSLCVATITSGLLYSNTTITV